VVEAGFKYGMTDLAGAIGLVQLRRAASMHARRRAIAARYDAGLSQAVACGLELPVERPGYEHAWHLYVVRLPLDALRIGRNEFVAELAVRNIGASVHYRPLPDHPHFRASGHSLDLHPVTAAEAPRLVSLPIHSMLTDDDVDDVCDAVTETLAAFRR
jgi:dTDP-4-amino-4,6-dideoxygalactose transaminase